ncbi:hypothetical protein N9087_00955 [bacterium]|nr:hypothetical protein [Rubripirellula sp.]MDB4506236.1 hypothetical protein [bacterium]MDB4645092.1 hypothetical protein [Rubripirellula sp.]MDB4770752.1 hypothetical protein [bacterium]MDC0326277.1 hypothetical protein [bacterium]
MMVARNYEKSENIARDRKPLQVEIRATGTFQSEDGKWKKIGHHADLLP